MASGLAETAESAVAAAWEMAMVAAEATAGARVRAAPEAAGEGAG